MTTSEGATTERSYLELYTDQFLIIEQAMQAGDWEAVIQHGLQYLELLPSAPDQQARTGNLHNDFRILAYQMMQLDHDYDSVALLLHAKDTFADFLSGFFVALDKKGVQVPSPAATQADAELTMYICKGMHALIRTRLADRSI